MSGDKHTAGPWEIVGHCIRTVVAKNERGGIDGGFLIAECSIHWPSEEHWANAQLIAAAPDLLALARQYAAECGECDGNGTVCCGQYLDGQCCSQTSPCPDCEGIRAVISKAVGP